MDVVGNCVKSTHFLGYYLKKWEKRERERNEHKKNIKHIKESIWKEFKHIFTVFFFIHNNEMFANI